MFSWKKVCRHSKILFVHRSALVWYMEASHDLSAWTSIPTTPPLLTQISLVGKSMYPGSSPASFTWDHVWALCHQVKLIFLQNVDLRRPQQLWHKGILKNEYSSSSQYGMVQVFSLVVGPWALEYDDLCPQVTPAIHYNNACADIQYNKFEITGALGAIAHRRAGGIAHRRAANMPSFHQQN